MAKSELEIKREGLELLMRPIVEYCLSQGMGLMDIIDTSKAGLVDIAKEKLEQAQEKVTVSRLSTLTGMQRRTVMQYIDRPERDVDDYPAAIASRIINRWKRDRRFTTQSGRPKILSLGEANSEFNQLVKSISNDIHPKSILFALSQIGAIEVREDSVKLVGKAYISNKDASEALQMLASDTSDLIHAILDNVYGAEDESPNYHVAAVFDNIDKSDLPKIRAWIDKNCSATVKKANDYLSKLDQDLNPDPKKEGGERVTLCMFSRTT